MIQTWICLSFHETVNATQFSEKTNSMTANRDHIIIALDGTSASGKSTNARIIARKLGYVYVDTGAMYRTLAWYCLQKKVDLNNTASVASHCRKWKASLICVDQCVRLVVDNYYPVKEIRTSKTSEAVPQVAAIPGVRTWMKHKQRECLRFGNLVMEGRDIGSNVFPETDFKFFLDASLEERSRRRAAEGVEENLAARDQKDSQRAAAPLMIPLGAKVINNSGQTPEETSDEIIRRIHAIMEAKNDPISDSKPIEK
jgi:cytidylate kinase